MGKSGQEDSLIFAFNRRFEKKAWDMNKEFRSIAMNGQDRFVLADVMFADEARWVLVEFKSWGESGRTAEKLKDKSKLLCAELAANPQMRELHDKCHYSGFGVATNLNFNVYRKQFCPPPEKATQPDGEFIDAFYGREIGIPPDQAEIYIQWLMKVGAKSQAKRRLKLLIDTGNEQIAMTDLQSPVAVSKWLFDVHQINGTKPPSMS